MLWMCLFFFLLYMPAYTLQSCIKIGPSLSIHPFLYIHNIKFFIQLTTITNTTTENEGDEMMWCKMCARKNAFLSFFVCICNACVNETIRIEPMDMVPCVFLCSTQVNIPQSSVSVTVNKKGERVFFFAFKNILA